MSQEYQYPVNSRGKKWSANNNKTIMEFFKLRKQTQRRSMETSGRVEDAKIGSYHSQVTSERKVTHTLMGESPMKRRKFHSSEGGGFSRSCTVPACIKVQDFKPDNNRAAKSKSDNNIGIVVVQPDSPGGDR